MQVWVGLCAGVGRAMQAWVGLESQRVAEDRQLRSRSQGQIYLVDRNLLCFQRAPTCPSFSLCCLSFSLVVLKT